MNFVSIISLRPYTIVRLDRPENRSSLLELVVSRSIALSRIVPHGRGECEFLLCEKALTCTTANEPSIFLPIRGLFYSGTISFLLAVADRSMQSGSVVHPTVKLFVVKLFGTRIENVLRR